MSNPPHPTPTHPPLSHTLSFSLSLFRKEERGWGPRALDAVLADRAVPHFPSLSFSLCLGGRKGGAGDREHSMRYWPTGQVPSEQPDRIRTSIYYRYSGSMKITAHLDRISHCKT